MGLVVPILFSFVLFQGLHGMERDGLCSFVRMMQFLLPFQEIVSAPNPCVVSLLIAV